MLFILTIVAIISIQATLSFQLLSLQSKRKNFGTEHAQSREARCLHTSRGYVLGGGNYRNVVGFCSSTKILYSPSSMANSERKEARKKRKPRSNSIAIRWIVESIEKKLSNERKIKLKEDIGKNLKYERKHNFSNDNSTMGEDHKQVQISTERGGYTQDDERILIQTLYQICEGMKCFWIFFEESRYLY